jgi:hypothetical protein
MELISDDSRRYVLHRRLARRWIREGGVLIATARARAGDRSTFDFAETVTSGATLQVTLNLREVSKACRFLSDYAVYLWNCDHEGDYLLCGPAENDAFNCGVPFDVGGARPYRRVAAACYAGRFPKFSLDIYDTKVDRPTAARAAIMTRLLLPQGLCAAIYQNPPTQAAAKHLTSPRAPFARALQTVAQDA